MNRQNDLINRINDKYDKLSKSQKQIAEYIKLNYEKVVFFTASKLAMETGVSESTVVRFAAILGYDGYPSFRKALEEHVKNKLNAMQRMESTFEKIDKDHVLKSVLHTDAEKIKSTVEAIDEKAFNKAVEKILAAEKIYIIGIRSSAPLASFLNYYFNIIFDNVRFISANSVNELFEQLYRISKQDVLIGISFPRYSRNTLKAVEFAKKRGSEIIAITDSYLSPLTAFTDYNIVVENDMISIVDSLVAPLSVVNALIVAICIKKQEEVIHTFESLEEIWSTYNVYKSDDDDNIDID